LESKISTSSPETSSLAFNFCFRRYPAQLKTGPSGDGATSGVGHELYWWARLATTKSSSMSFVQLRTRPERPNRASQQRISQRIHAEHKVDRGLRRSGKIQRRVDATLPPGERVKQNKDHAE
jgi:hypothetical protein